MQAILARKLLELADLDECLEVLGYTFGRDLREDLEVIALQPLATWRFQEL